MTRCWIKAAGAGWSAGPFTLGDLRNLRASGLLPQATLVSHDAHGGFRCLADWPELVAALDSPDARSVPGGRPLVLGDHVPEAGTVSPETGDTSGSDRHFRLTEAVFDDVNAGDVAPKRSSLDALALNRAAEPEPPLVFPPWHRTPWVRNVARFLPLLVIGLWLLRVPHIAAAGLVLGGGAWYVFVINPARWED